MSRSIQPTRAAPKVDGPLPRGTAQPKKHLWTNKGCKLGGTTLLSRDDQQTRSMRDQILAAVASRSHPPPPAPSTPPATNSAPPPSSSSLTNVPTIPVQNRFDVISEEGNE